MIEQTISEVEAVNAPGVEWFWDEILNYLNIEFFEAYDRVGMEDNLYVRKGELAESNADLGEKADDLNAALTGRPIDTPKKTREFHG